MLAVMQLQANPSRRGGGPMPSAAREIRTPERVHAHDEVRAASLGEEAARCSR